MSRGNYRIFPVFIPFIPPNFITWNPSKAISIQFKIWNHFFSFSLPFPQQTYAGVCVCVAFSFTLYYVAQARVYHVTRRHSIFWIRDFEVFFIEIQVLMNGIVKLISSFLVVWGFTSFSCRLLMLCKTINMNAFRNLWNSIFFVFLFWLWLCCLLCSQSLFFVVSTYYDLLSEETTLCVVVLWWNEGKWINK